LGGAWRALLLLLLLPALYPGGSVGVAEYEGVDVHLRATGYTGRGTRIDLEVRTHVPGENVVVNSSLLERIIPDGIERLDPYTLILNVGSGVESVSVVGLEGLDVLSVRGMRGGVVNIENVSARGISVIGNALLYAKNVSVDCGGFLFMVELAFLEGLRAGGCVGEIAGIAHARTVVKGLVGVWEATVKGMSRVELENSTFSNLYLEASSVSVRNVQVGVLEGFNSSSSPGIIEIVAEGPASFEASTLFLEYAFVEASHVSLEASRVSLLGSAMITATRMTLANSTLSLSSVSVRGAGDVAINGCTLSLREPLRIHMARGNATLEVEGSRFSCSDGCLTVALYDTRMRALISGSTFTGSGPAVSVVAYPPWEGRATVRVRESYFQDPAGPSVVVSGNTLRAGGLVIVLTGQATGGVTVESWLASPGGPLLEPAREAPFGYSVPGALQVIPALAHGGPSEYALVVKYPGVEEEPRVRLRGAAVVEAYADGVLVEPVEVAWGEYLVPRPAETLLLYLTPAPEPQPEPAAAETQTVEAPSPSEPEPVDVVEGEGGVPGLLLAAAAAAAGAGAAYVWARRR